MRKLIWTLALVVVPLAAAHACGGDDTSPGGSAGARTTGGSGGATGSTVVTTGTTGTTGGSAGR
jgi:hypothetical protein